MLMRKKKRGVERKVNKMLKIQIWCQWIDYELWMRFLSSVPKARMRFQSAGLLDVAGFAVKREHRFQSWTEKEATGSEPLKNLLKNGLWFYFQQQILLSNQLKLKQVGTAGAQMAGRT